jgi:hypothetical protein
VKLESESLFGMLVELVVAAGTLLVLVYMVFAFWPLIILFLIAGGILWIVAKVTR